MVTRIKVNGQGSFMRSMRLKKKIITINKLNKFKSIIKKL